MQTSNRQFGPLTLGALLGTSIGVAIFLFGISAIRTGDVQRSYQSLLFVAIGSAMLGCLLGFLAESLVRHPSLLRNRWVNHLVRPITFCTTPYLLVALSLRYYGDDSLMHGLGFWFSVLILPAMGFVYAWKRGATSLDDGRSGQ